MEIDPKLLIIRKPEKGISRRKIASAANAIVFWGISIYFFLATAGWIAGLFILDSVFNHFKSIVTLERSGELLLLLAFIAYLMIWSWSSYNRYRFSGERDRRRAAPMPTLSIEAISEDAGLPVKEIEEMQQAKIAVCRFDKNHKLESVDCFSCGNWATQD